MHRVRTGRGGHGVVGFHGWSGDHTTFDPLIQKLPEAVSFYSFDLPGCGKSPKPKVWEIRSVARSIAEEVAALGKEKVTLVGSCTGGLMALFVARELFEMGRGGVVGRLVMIDPFAVCPWYFRIFLTPLLGPLMYGVTFANPLGRWITDLFLKERRGSSVSLTESFVRVDHRVSLATLRMFERAGEPEQFRGMDIPVEIIRGEKTFTAVKQAVERWRSVWPMPTQRKPVITIGRSRKPCSETTRAIVSHASSLMHERPIVLKSPSSINFNVFSAPLKRHTTASGDRLNTRSRTRL